MIRIVIAEDQSLVLGALAALLDLEEDFEIVGRATDGASALALALSIRPDVLVSDIEMPELSGIDVAARLKVAGSPTRVLIVTTFGRPGFPFRNQSLRCSPTTDLAASRTADSTCFWVGRSGLSSLIRR